MIPKIIHYCWLSNDPFPEIIQKCIDSWKEKLPDYEFIKWDTNRFDINSVPYVKEAFEAKKYAFCADYIRAYALYTMGGIYLDSDVMVHKSLDKFLHHKSFSSLEFNYYHLYSHISNKKEVMVGIEAAVLGSEKGCEWLKDVLDYLGTQHYTNSKKQEKNIMPRVIARILNKKYGFYYYPVYQKLKDDFHVYPAEVFSSKLMDGDNPVKYTTHLAANSWGFCEDKKFRNKVRELLKKAKLLEVTRKIRGIQKIGDEE